MQPPDHASDSEGAGLLCPSSPCDWPGVRLIGVVGGAVNRPKVMYTGPQPVSPDLLACAAPATPTEVFRFASPCQENRCVQFDGTRCRLSELIVRLSPPEDGTASLGDLPPCGIRSRCRWWREKGVAACRSCPGIATDNPAIRSDLRDGIRHLHSTHAGPLIQSTPKGE